MKLFLINLLRLIRPLSNIKNVALVLLAFYISQSQLDLFKIILGVISLSLICSANYAYNSLSDCRIDKNNRNKQHYSEAVEYFGNENVKIIVFLLTLAGCVAGFFINAYFLTSLVLLSLTGFLYSFKKTRLKEKVILDVLFGAVLTFFFRVVASWFIFSQTLPPLFVVLALVLAKTAGYLTYKEADRPFLEKLKIKNSITLSKKTTILVVSAVLWVLAILLFVFMCFNSQILPIRFLYLTPFAIIPLLIIYLSLLGKIKTRIKDLRTLGLVYWLLVLIAAVLFL